MTKIGIIGKGFVGTAVQNGFSTLKDCQIKIYDKNPLKSQNSLKEVVSDSVYLFISLPTPSNLDGSINLDTIYECLEQINEIKDSKAIILLRSTMIPGSTKLLQDKYPELKIVFNPEFLTEKNANEDFINQSRIILGGEKILTERVAELYKKRFGTEKKIIETTFETAELIKYMNNCFLATKVSFMNEMKLISENCNADWEKAVYGFSQDERVGKSHISVPGHDGKLGFGGSCLPKDVQALIIFAKQNNISLNTLSGAWKTNLELRPEQDWNKLVGRAIVKKK
jgi:UDPglucose 6-dehydrogenase